MQGHTKKTAFKSYSQGEVDYLEIEMRDMRSSDVKFVLTLE
jgi:hypothetical protein